MKKEYKKRGFTLVELLAVIVVLAVIALIATPMILGVIEKSKKAAFQASATAIIDAVDYYKINHIEEGNDNCIIFNFALRNTERIVIDSIIYEPIKELNLKGTQPTEGEMTICKNTIQAKFGNEKYTYIYDELGGKVVDGKPSDTDSLLNNEIVKNNGGFNTIKNKKSPDFSKAAITSTTYDAQSDTTFFTKEENGMYSTLDDYGTSYYFRGSVSNNYLTYGGFCWRIIRINGDNSIRLIYQGTSCSSSGADVGIGTSAYNELIEDNAYVGYMYGKLNADTYEETHANTNDSTVKKFLDNWYEKNLKGTVYEKYIGDTLFCNDRSVYVGTGIGTSYLTRYSYMERAANLVDNFHVNPTLQCTNKHDRFTVNDTEIGNGDLKYPIALITGDEITMAGVLMRSGTGYVANAINKDVYLWSNFPSTMLTMTPFIYRDIYYAGNIEMNQHGAMNFFKNSVERLVRPVINLKSSTPYKGGDGTSNNPYRVY